MCPCDVDNGFLRRRQSSSTADRAMTATESRRNLSRPSTRGPTLPGRHRPPVKTANCSFSFATLMTISVSEKFRYLRVALGHHTSSKYPCTLPFAFRSTDRDDQIVDVHEKTTMIEVLDSVYPPAGSLGNTVGTDGVCSTAGCQIPCVSRSEYPLRL